MLKVAWLYSTVEAGEYTSDLTPLRIALGILDVAAWLTLVAAAITALRRSAR